MDKSILVVGLACVDTVYYVPEFPKEDIVHRVLDSYWQRGGNAANTSCVLSRLGAKVEFLGTFSKDRENELLKSVFLEHNIDTRHCPTKTGSTATSVVINNLQNGSRTILHDDTKFKEIEFEDFEKLNLSTYKWIHFEGRSNSNELKLMIDHALKYNSQQQDQNKITVSMEIESPDCVELDESLDKVDLLFVSKEYAMDRGCTNKEDAVQKLANKCRKGAHVVCAWGEDGAAALSDDGVLHSSPCFPPPKVIDTLAAGDTFIAAVISYVSQGKDIKEALIYGCKVAGTKCGMKGFDELVGGVV